MKKNTLFLLSALVLFSSVIIKAQTGCFNSVITSINTPNYPKNVTLNASPTTSPVQLPGLANGLMDFTAVLGTNVTWANQPGFIHGVQIKDNPAITSGDYISLSPYNATNALTRKATYIMNFKTPMKSVSFDSGQLDGSDTYEIFAYNGNVSVPVTAANISFNGTPTGWSITPSQMGVKVMATGNPPSPTIFKTTLNAVVTSIEIKAYQGNGTPNEVVTTNLANFQLCTKEAVPDFFNNTAINTTQGGAVGDVTLNDYQNGQPVNDANINITLLNNGGIAGATINSNGILTIPNGVAPGLYVLTYQICDKVNTTLCDTATATFQVFADTDGDGISDVVDGDNDNDGILDVNENKFCEMQPIPNGTVTGTGNHKGKLLFFNWGASNTQLVNGASTSVTYKGITYTATISNISATDPSNPNSGLFPRNADKAGAAYFGNMYDVATAGYNEAIMTTSSNGSGFFTGVAKFTIKVKATKNNVPVNYPLNLMVFDNEVTSSSVLGQEYMNVISDGGDFTSFESRVGGSAMVQGNRLTFNNNFQDNYITEKASQINVEMITYNGKQSFGVAVVLNCDFDQDGIPNIYDHDSDNDGCADAVEGGGNITSSQLNPNGSIAGNVDANGVPVIVGAAGQTINNSQNTYVNDCVNSCNALYANWNIVDPTGANTLGDAIITGSLNGNNFTTTYTLANANRDPIITNASSQIESYPGINGIWYTANSMLGKQQLNITTSGGILKFTFNFASPLAKDIYMHFQAIDTSYSFHTGTPVSSVNGYFSTLTNPNGYTFNYTDNVSNSGGFSVKIPAGTQSFDFEKSSVGGDNFMVFFTTDCALCYYPATTGTGLPTKHGITTLGRAGADNGNWPMVRKGAYTALESKTKGFVITRMTTNQVNAIQNPQNGMMVFDTQANSGVGCLKIYNGTAWQCYTTQACDY